MNNDEQKKILETKILKSHIFESRSIEGHRLSIPMLEELRSKLIGHEIYQTDKFARKRVVGVVRNVTIPDNQIVVEILEPFSGSELEMLVAVNFFDDEIVGISHIIMAEVAIEEVKIFSWR